jgi:lysophospholipase L1-like esterase
MLTPPPSHRRELFDFLVFSVLLGLLALEAFGVPQVEAVRPWIKGEPIPLVHLLVEEEISTPVERPGPVATALALSPQPPPRPDWERLPERPPAVRHLLEIPTGSMDTFFLALADTEAGGGQRITRVLHWGDSTIAADGITGTVRDRLQARFGDGGPGFLPIKVDPRWVVRSGIARWPRGEWQGLNISMGGAPYDRYGLSGSVSLAEEESWVTLGGLERADKRQELVSFDVHYQVQPGGGSLVAIPRNGPTTVLETGGPEVRDAFRELRMEDGTPYFWLKARGDGPVTVYGVSLETAGPGVTWETLAVAGSSLGSLRRQDPGHLAGQVAHRRPDLVVYLTGGNEMEYDSFLDGEGESFVSEYVAVLDRLRAGAPQASCLVISPVDQAVRLRGKVRSKALMAQMVERQREAAAQAGCAFWDAWRVMGGEGSFARWMAMDPPLTWTDLMHLSQEGREVMGESLADAILDAYAQWTQAYAVLDTGAPPRD